MNIASTYRIFITIKRLQISSTYHSNNIFPLLVSSTKTKPIWRYELFHIDIINNRGEYMITFLGDIYLNKPYKIEFNIENYICNLEYPISKHGKPALNKINLRQEKSYIEETFKQHPLAVCLANNHIMDYGEEAYKDTLSFCVKNNIKYFGAGNQYNNYNNPALLKIDTATVGILGYCCPSTSSISGGQRANGSSPLNEKRIAQDIDALKEKADRIIVVFHWGAEEIFYPKPYDVKIAHMAIDKGADLIVGHHSHCIQSYEIYKEKHIFYGLGNCIMPDIDVMAYFTNNGKSIRFRQNQQIWNKYSLGIKYNPSNNDIEIFRMYFDGGTLTQSPYDIKKYYLPIKSVEEYQRAFIKKFLCEKIKGRVRKYKQSPWVPGLKDAKYFYGLMWQIIKKQYS
ncbi:MAG TPA: hypothetical protein DF296_01880 [Candidatus Margulisbacteria bacterium]|nr:hypothetical protein [Candidatus Margulisiibacteriota bacterium]HCT83926.1 hypothetical protein [Candidatus Margulisiibacteriota bacterium]